MESLAIQDPTNRLIDKKCNQKINKNASFEKTAYRSLILKYKLNPSRIFPDKNIL